jgi:hypothetical protein
VSGLSRTRVGAVVVILGGALAVAAHLGRAWAQFSAPGNPQLPQPSGQLGNVDRTRMPDDEPYANHEIQERQFKRLRQEHQQQLIDDTARLLQLATALKAEVDKGNQPTSLPTDVLKQTDEISKLAKRVSERIKTQ